MPSNPRDPNNRYVILPRHEAERAVIPGKYAVISIMDYPQEDQKVMAARIPTGYYAILRLWFDDHVPGVGMPGPWVEMSAKQAEQIVTFWLRYHEQVDRFMVHCRAGISRSAAIAHALGWLERDAEVMGYASQPPCFPNMYVKYLIGQAARKLQAGVYGTMDAEEWKDITSK